MHKKGVKSIQIKLCLLQLPVRFFSKTTTTTACILMHFQEIVCSTTVWSQVLLVIKLVNFHFFRQHYIKILVVSLILGFKLCITTYVL